MQELVVHSLHVGKASAYLEALTTHGQGLREAQGARLEGLWTSEFGVLHQVWELWSYADESHLSAVDASMARDVAWRTRVAEPAAPWLRESRKARLFPITPFKPEAGKGPFFEFRRYVTRPGTVQEFAAAGQEFMALRESFSPNTGFWIDGAPATGVTHLWAYPSLEERMRVKAAYSADPRWGRFLQRIVPLLETMHTTLLLPVPSSRLQ